MSLYVGRLSPHVRREELEHIFQRFGRCNVQLKDGYGFAIYEVTANAERALKSLRGKKICGEQISLSWSNRQPRPFQRFARNNRFYDHNRERSFRDEGNGPGNMGSQNRRNFNSGASQIPATILEDQQLDDASDKEAFHAGDDADGLQEEKGQDYKKPELDESGALEPNPVETDRWGEPASDLFTGHRVENNEFDRYEPYHGYSGRYENSPEYPPENGRRGKSIDEIDRRHDKSRPTCYQCGLAGHIARNCPEGDAKWGKFSKFKHRNEEIISSDRGDRRLKRPRRSSWGRSNSARDPLSSRPPEKVRKLIRRKEGLSERKEKTRHKLRGESQKRVSKKGHGTTKKLLRKRRARRSSISPLSSDSSTSSSHSLSKSSRSRSATGSSRSATSQSRSAFSTSRSASISSYSKSVSSRSRSRSNFPTPQSLSVSLDPKPCNSPEDVNMDVPAKTSPKVNLEYASGREPTNLLPSNLETSEPKGTCPMLKDETPFNSSNADVQTNDKHLVHDGNGAEDFACRTGDKENNPSNNQLENVASMSDKIYEDCREMSDRRVLVPVKPTSQIKAGSVGSTSTKMATQELFLALRHFGLPVPDETESEISVEEYFGAARLWPWEAIYYRRLKKGPISTENYARRVRQNKEFGIVDKYIRSSSGWGEFT